MFFRRKGWLRKEFDEKLLTQLSDIRTDWANQKALVDKSFDPSEEILSYAKLTEAKYFYLLKQAKNRKINIRK
ncbi:YaaL family protein [Robertmurraya sp. Marseille-Q9965]